MKSKKLAETAEVKRLDDARNNSVKWWQWGPYLSERQWGTVREDYSKHGNAWEYLPHDHARKRAYRWGEDGIAGISDSNQYLCFSLALWNGKDPILKERLFGLTGNEGNHGEDVKEYYYYLNNVPSHSYMKYLYKYPHNEYPYSQLVNENKRRMGEPNRGGLEYELIDTGIFEDDKYFDVFIEYAKNDPNDILIKINAVNRGPVAKELYLLPTIWFRNTWAWGYDDEKPTMKLINSYTIELNHKVLGKKWLYCENPDEIVFTENDTNVEIFGGQNNSQYVKDGINEYIVHGRKDRVNPNKTGTKAAPSYKVSIMPGETKTIRLRLSSEQINQSPFNIKFEKIFEDRESEMEEFYNSVCPYDIPDDLRNIQVQAYSGMLWSKQFYYYVVEEWLNGDPAYPEPPCERKYGRNKDWKHLYNQDILSMPDKWEYPWFAAWDLAFHTIPFAAIDPDFAKRQLHLFTKEWYMHPNGQLPAYEWSFGDVNPPVTAWAAWRVYKIENKMYNRQDVEFLKTMFNKLLLYFTWWVNKKDAYGNNIFEGGFLGLDNISLIDRSNPDVRNAHIQQADGTAWMGMYCLNMLKIATEIAKTDSSYEDWAGKFLQHFFYIADAMNKVGGDSVNLWDSIDKFYYDIISYPNGNQSDTLHQSIKVRSMVGLIPLFVAETLDLDSLINSDTSKYNEFNNYNGLKSQLKWFMENRPNLTGHENISIKGLDDDSKNGVFLSFLNTEKLTQILNKMLDENEFLSSYGVRALSKYHKDHPYTLNINGVDHSIDYQPAESNSAMFGGNSNWRGPVWFPVNFLIIESLQKFHHYYGDNFKVEFPTGTGNMMNLWDISMELSKRLIKVFEMDPQNGNQRPVFGLNNNGFANKFQNDPHWNNNILFYEYFHGDIGAGIGASHQTGWTGLVAKLIQQYATYGGFNSNEVSDCKKVLVKK